jgi:hypothetical protein
MATAVAEAGGRSGVRALVLDRQGREALVRDPYGCACKKYGRGENVHRRAPPLQPTTTKMTA